MKIKSLLMTFVAVTTISFSSCSKDVDLVGTSWEGDAITTNDYEGSHYEFTTHYVMNFTDKTKGYFDLSITYMQDGEGPSNYGSGKLDFTWTFDGEKEGKIEAKNAQTGNDIIDVFKYDKDSKTITLYDGGVVVELKKI